MTRMTDVFTVAVPVSDQDKAVLFFTETLGFEKRLDAELQPGFRWVEVAPPGATTSVALVKAGSELPTGVDTGIRLATKDARADHEYLTQQGIDAGELLLWESVPPMFSFVDPDGNRFYVTETE
jgi:catechol 2,3-dioxygenase-like lactoylglutathione lyase family enzyme